MSKCRLRKCVGILAVLAVLFLACPVAASPAVISIEDAGADYDSTDTVSINITGVTGLGAATIKLHYDKDVVIVDSVTAGDMGGMLFPAIDNSSGVTTMGWFSATGLDGDYVFANVELHAVGSGGATSPLQLEVTELADSYGDPIDYTTDDGVFTVVTCWESYQTSERTEVWGTSSNHYDSSCQAAYMKGEGFNDASEYTVGYYDGGGTKVQSEPRSSSGGELLSQCDLTTDSGAAAGTWHSVVFNTTGTIPSAYDDAQGDPNYVVEDDFIVDASAIPEFPTIMAGIGVAGLCFGIYYWMRKRKQRQVAAV